MRVSFILLASCLLASSAVPLLGADLDNLSEERLDSLVALYDGLHRTLSFPFTRKRQPGS